MSVLSQFKSLLRRTEGQVTIIFALASIPMMIAAGSAIDYMRYSDVKTSIQAGLDGAALAAALPRSATDAERTAIARQYFKKNASYKGMDGIDVDINVLIGADSVRTSVSSRMSTSFMALAGINSMEINEMAEVMRPFADDAEIALVLDYSGSMNRLGKYQSMATAATKMINDLAAATKPGAVKIGLVPFSAMVYTSMPREYVNQASATAIWTGCTQDRKYPHNTNVDTPQTAPADPDTKWGYIEGGSENSGVYGCPAYISKNLKIVPLTADLASVKTAIGAMRPLGNTNIPLGAEFGWNLLDPQAPYAEGVAYSHPKTKKFLVLLTDGVQTSKEFGEDGSRSVALGNDNLVELCTNMGNAGVTVFAIAYDITNPKVTDLLKACAGERYFEPSASGSEITSVFSQITQQITNRIVRLSR